MNKFKPRDHQVRFAELWGSKGRVLNFDGCGTGKTLACIHAVKTFWPDKRVLVLAPLSVVQPAWGEDLKFGWPQTTISIATGSKPSKLKALKSESQWILTNHDSIKLIYEEDLAHRFDVIIVDEADAFRNIKAQRTKALIGVSRDVEFGTLMTGTPTPKSVTDVWSIAYACDFGARLGSKFTTFKYSMCDAFPIPGAPPGAMRFVDKEGAHEQVTMMLSDITSRVALSDVVELPDTITRNMRIELPKKLRDAYKRLVKDSVLELHTGALLDAGSAGVRANKLLQTLSGSLYDEEGVAQFVHSDRCDLAMQIASQTDHALVVFNWKHQRDELVKKARSMDMSYEIIDGDVTVARRNSIVQAYQAGKIRVLFIQPQSAGHGITLTKADTVIWTSPTYRADLYEQVNARIIRSGQKRKTQIVNIAAIDTIEEDVYDKLNDKRERMFNLLDTLAEISRVA